MQKTQRWMPDTCGCEIEQVFDYSTDPATLVSQTLIKTCDRHTKVDDSVSDNLLKNTAINKIAELTSVKAEDIAWDFKEGTLEVTAPVGSKTAITSEMTKLGVTVK